jgi:ferredoxin
MPVNGIINSSNDNRRLIDFIMKKYLKTYPERCNGCNICMSVCSKLYFKENNPELSCIKITALNEAFDMNVCDQCGTCVAECPTMALTINKKGVVMLNKNLCIGCYACVAICPTDSMRRYHGSIVPFKCIACGSCADECPEKALEIVEEE